MLYYQQQQKRLLALCRNLAAPAPEHLETMALIDEWLLDQLKPQLFDDGSPQNVLTLQRRRFAQTCAALAEKGFAHAQQLTVFDFNSAIDYLSEKHKPA